MKYVIEYEHLKDGLVNDSKKEWHFNKVKNIANKHKLELSDNYFKQLFKLHMSGRDVDWIAHKMGSYNRSLVEALVLYITY